MAVLWHLVLVSVVGIDGCKTGWVAVSLEGISGVSAHHLRAISAVAAEVPDTAVITIDIPIGLPEDGRREADVAARAFLGARRNSVFFTPVRRAVEAATHAEATAASLRATGGGISQQSFALSQKILEVERWLPSAPCPVFEVHPEVSFAVLLGAAASAPKKTWAGMVERWRALTRAGIVVDGLDGPATLTASVDDMLDAAVAAWSARRIAAGTARTFPAVPQPVADGRIVAIWA